MRKGLVQSNAAGVPHQLVRLRILDSVPPQLWRQRAPRATSNWKQGEWLTPGTLFPPLEQRDYLPVAGLLFRKQLRKPPRLNSGLRKPNKYHTK